MKILALGSIIFSKEVFNYLLKKNTKIDYILGKKESKFNSDFFDTVKYFSKKSHCKYIKNINSKSSYIWIKKRNPDLIICLGWSSLINKKILNIPKHGVIGYHPADLPANRGRHPIIWSLVLGLKKISSTFFLMNEKADAGDIISKKNLNVRNFDRSGTVYKKLARLAGPQLLQIINNLKKEKITKIKQKNSKSNFWRKRNELDGKIDWRMNSDIIFNLVRALDKPYPGATFEFNKRKIIVWSAKKVENLAKNIEPGKIIGFKKRKPIVKCGKGALVLEKIEPKINFKLHTYL